MTIRNPIVRFVAAASVTTLLALVIPFLAACVFTYAALSGGLFRDIWAEMTPREKQ